MRRLCREVQDQAAVSMRLPEDIHERMIAINTMHNVFDRIDEAVDAYLKAKGDGHE